MRYHRLASALLFLLAIAGRSYAADADCYDKGDFYFIPATDLLAAKKKALLCFFAEITVKSSSSEDNQNIEFKQETKLEATSPVLDWQGLRMTDTPNLYRWAIKDVNDNLKRLASANSKKLIPVEKEVQEVWRSNAIKKEIIEINSRPENASVTFDGVDNACQTPCKLEVLHGSHAISLWKQDYSRVSGTISVDSSHDNFSFDLKENISRVYFKDCPTGADIRVDGNRYGMLSDSALKLAPGTYILEFEHPEYFKANQKISVNLGDSLTVGCGLKPKIGGIDISARNSQGEPVKANVEVDGVNIGKTPGIFEVRAGSRRVKVSTNDEAWENTITASKSTTIPIVAQLSPIESEEEKTKRRAYRSFALMFEIGSMNEIKVKERSGGTEYKFDDCSDTTDAKKGTTSRFYLSKNLTNNFGINAGYLKGQYETCKKSFNFEKYSFDVKRYDIGFSGPTIGVNAALVNQWDHDPSSGSKKTYTRWIDLRLSHIPNFDFTIQNNQTTSKSHHRVNGVTLAEVSLVTTTFQFAKLSLFNVGYVKGFEMPEDSPLILGDFSLLSIIGFGIAF